MLAKYKEGIRDMKAGFAVTIPTISGVDWSFVPKVSREIAAEGGEAQPGPRREK